MTQKLKKAKGKPGSRFEDQYHRNRKKPRSRRTSPVLNIAMGSAIVLVGLFMVPAPGPGWVIVFIGGGILAREFLGIARGMDWLEIRLRKLARWGKKHWADSPLPLKALMVVLAFLVSAAGIYGAWWVVTE